MRLMTDWGGCAQASLPSCWAGWRCSAGLGGEGPGCHRHPLSPPRREVLQIDQFLKETAAREANAKVRLQHFIEELLDRADRAEKQLQIISSSCGTTPNGSLGRCGTPGAKAIGRPVPARAQARAPRASGHERSRGFSGGCKRVERGHTGDPRGDACNPGGGIPEGSWLVSGCHMG